MRSLMGDHKKQRRIIQSKHAAHQNHLAIKRQCITSIAISNVHAYASPQLAHKRVDSLRRTHLVFSSKFSPLEGQMLLHGQATARSWGASATRTQDKRRDCKKMASAQHMNPNIYTCRSI